MHCSYPSCTPLVHKRVYEDLKQDLHKKRSVKKCSKNNHLSDGKNSKKHYVILAMIILIILILKE